MEDARSFLTNQELRELAKEAGIDPDDFVWELDWPKLRRFAFLVEKTACSKAYDKEEDNNRLFEKTHSPSGAQQSTVPSNAQKEWVLVPRGPLQEARDIAMEWTLKGRVPECGKFGQIAQDLDAMLTSVFKQP